MNDLNLIQMRNVIETKVCIIDDELEKLGIKSENELWVNKTVYIDSIEAYSESTDEVLEAGLTCVFMKSGESFIVDIKYVQFKSMMKDYEQVLSDGSCKLETPDLDDELERLDSITGALNNLLKMEDRFANPAVYQPQTGIMSDKTYRYLILAVWSLMAVGIIAHLVIE